MARLSICQFSVFPTGLPAIRITRFIISNASAFVPSIFTTNLSCGPLAHTWEMNQEASRIKGEIWSGQLIYAESGAHLWADRFDQIAEGEMEIHQGRGGLVLFRGPVASDA